MRGTGISEAAAKASVAETRALLQNPLLAPAAGGPGGRITDRGRKVVGISGEVRVRRLEAGLRGSGAGDAPPVSPPLPSPWPTGV